MGSLRFFVDLILLAALGLTQPVIGINTRDIFWG